MKWYVQIIYGRKLVGLMRGQFFAESGFRGRNNILWKNYVFLFRVFVSLG